MTPAFSKAQRRLAARAVVAALSPEVRAEQARRLSEMVLGSREWQGACRPLLFVPLSDEIDLRALIPAGLAAGKRVALPYFNPETGAYEAREIQDAANDLVAGRFQIQEPRAECRTLPLSDLDYLLVPGLAFDAAGGRLGRGKGFYDRLLAQTTGMTLGVGFIEQLGPPVPVEAHDHRLHGVFTAAGLHWSLRVN